MTAIARSAIRTAVRTVLDSEGYTTAVSGTLEVSYLDSIIDAAALTALTDLLRRAPLWMVSEGKDFSGSDTDMAPGPDHLFIRLPDDFLRLISFKEGTMQVPVTELRPDTHPSYALQSRTGVKGNPFRPVGYLTLHNFLVSGVSTPVRSMEVVGVDIYNDSLEIKWARYLATPAYSTGSDPTLDVPGLLEQAFYYQAASLVAAETGETALSQSLQATADRLIG